jgi:hypothetical protein
MNGYGTVTKESIIDETPFSGNLPPPLFSKEGQFLPLAKGGEEGFYNKFFNLSLTNMSDLLRTD